MDNISFSMTFSSEMYNIKDAIVKIMSFLEQNIPNISESDFFDFKLVFSELLINAVIHGNKNDHTKNVTLHIKIDDSIVTSTISDEGTGFDYMKLINKKCELGSFLDENGRGICLVTSLTDLIVFNDIGNEIKFAKKVSMVGQNINS